MPKITRLQDDLKVSIKRDIARFYFTGQSTLKSIQQHYNLKPNIIKKLAAELVDESNRKTNNLF